MLPVLARVEGPVRGHPADRDQGRVQYQLGVSGPRRVPDRLAELPGAAREQFHGLVHVPRTRWPHRSDSDPGHIAGYSDGEVRQ